MKNEYAYTGTELVTSLKRLLKHLNFSDIRIHSDIETAETEADLIINDVGYTPSLMAKKNDVIYYFEFVEDNPGDLKRIRQPLQSIIERGHKRWDADFVLVTKYGNKDSVRDWCREYDLPVDQIWEM